MNKKVILMASVLVCGLSQHTSAQTSVQTAVVLHLSGDKFTGTLGERPRSPMQPLTVGLDDHTLYLGNVSFSVILQLLNENDEVVYSTFVVANTSSVELPSALKGKSMGHKELSSLQLGMERR